MTFTFGDGDHLPSAVSVPDGGQIGLWVMTEYQSPPLPSGIVPQYSLYGEPQNVLQAHAQVVNGVQVVPVLNSHIPYIDPDAPLVGDRTKKCHAKGDTCNGWRIGGSDFCAVHAGKMVPPTPEGAPKWSWSGSPEALDEP